MRVGERQVITGMSCITEKNYANEILLDKEIDYLVPRATSHSVVDAHIRGFRNAAVDTRCIQNSDECTGSSYKKKV